MTKQEFQESISSPTFAKLKKIGFRQWDKQKDGKVVMLIPKDYFKLIPEGLEVVDIFGEREKFKKGKFSAENRIGMLSFGVEVKAPKKSIRPKRKKKSA